MSKNLVVQKYFDITCDLCAHSRSTDFGKGMETNLAVLRKLAIKEGWRSRTISGMAYTVCPHCANH